MTYTATRLLTVGDAPTLPLVILEGGEIAGCPTLSGITRGVFQSASLFQRIAPEA